MADQVELDPGSGGALIYTDELTVATSTVHAQRVKIQLGADGVDDGAVHSSNPLPVSTLPLTANLGTISSVATQATLAQVTTFTQSTNTILAQPLSSNTFRVTIAADDVGIGGGLQYVENTTSTAPTGTVMLWKSAVSTLKAVSSSFPLPVSSAPLTANIGTVSSLATETSLASTVSLNSSQLLRLNTISTVANSTNTMLLNIIASSTSSLWVQSVPGSAQSSIGGTVVIRTGLFTSGGTQIDSFGGGTQYVEGNTTTLPTGTAMLWKSAVSTMSPVATSLPLPVHMISTSVSIGGGTQYVDGNTTTAPTGTVMLWKEAVSTLRPASSGFPMPVNVVAGSLNANTEYLEGNTTTAPTGIVMLWKSAVSTLRAASTSDPLPVSTLPVTANIGTVSSLATEASAASTVSLASSVLLRLTEVSSNTASTNALLSTQTLSLTSTVSLASSILLRLNTISTDSLSTNTLLVQISSNTASTNALVSTGNLRLTDISTTTASTVSLASTIALRLAPVPTGIYVQPVPVSSNGLSVFMTLDADETEEQISATACTVYGIWAANTGTAGAYIKLFNGTSSAIQVSTATPHIVIPIPGSSTQSLVGANYNLGGLGITFSTACCVAAVTGAANFNTTAPAESTIICNIFYKN